MSSWTLGALGGAIWITPRAAGRSPAVSPLPIILLLCGLLGPLLLARLIPVPPPRSDHPLFDRRYFWAAQAPETPTIAPLLAAAQIKRVAAARGVPYFVVRRMVDDNTGEKDGTSEKDGVDLTALNLALDRHDREK